ncbi:unnamed protein product [Urochloa humidicola]
MPSSPSRPDRPLHLQAGRPASLCICPSIRLVQGLTTVLYMDHHIVPTSRYGKNTHRRGFAPSRPPLPDALFRSGAVEHTSGDQRSMVARALRFLHRDDDSERQPMRPAYLQR